MEVKKPNLALGAALAMISPPIKMASATPNGWMNLANVREVHSLFDKSELSIPIKNRDRR